jgi:hypothetical protein
MNIKTVLLILFIISSVVVSGCMNAENKILSYVEKTYNEEFEVEHVEKGSILFSGMYGKDKAIIHPKGNKDLVFLAGEYRNNEGNYYDTYVMAKWGEELKTSLKGTMEQELAGSPYKVTVLAEKGTYDASMLDMPFRKFVESNPDNVRIIVTTAIYTQGKPDAESYSRGIYNIYQDLKNLGAERYTLAIGFADESDEITDYIRTANVNNISWSNVDADVYGEINIDEGGNSDKPDSNISEELILTGPEIVVNYYEALGK